MTKFFFSMAFYVVVAQWLYAEIKLVAPNLAPVIDNALEYVQIPTHDQWGELDLPARLAAALKVGADQLNALPAHAEESDDYQDPAKFKRGEVIPLSESPD